MEKDLVKRMIKKDGSQRISFYQDVYADNPRYTTDEPLHFEDWDGRYSIMNNGERERKSSSARKLLEYFLCNYGNYKKIIGILVDNGKHMNDGNFVCNDALVYNDAEHRWDLMSNMLHYDLETKKNKIGWCLNNYYCEKKCHIDIYCLLDDVCDETINYLSNNLLTDEVKVASYSFNYGGVISFDDEVSCESEGICWLEKDEFLKYSGCNKDYWEGKTLREIEWLIDEIDAWSNNEVYGFVVENAIHVNVHKEYTNVEREDEDYEEIEWENTESVWGFYGDFDDVVDYMIEEAGFKKEELQYEKL